MKKVIVSLMAVLLCVSAANATILIGGSVQNGDFEDPTTGKVMVESGNVPSWSVWTEVATASNDTGTDTIAGGVAGVDTRILFIQPGGAVKNMTTETIDAGETFTYSLDFTTAGRSPADIALVYEDAGVFNVIAGTTLTINAVGTVDGSFTALAGEAYIGKAIGVGLISGGSWPEVDNATLTLVPEPATMMLLGLGGLLLRKRR